MEIDPKSLKNNESYKLLCSLLIPRPIAWVSTVNSEGKPNLAPFSFFGAVTSAPPTLMLSVGRRKGQLKDTSNNLLATKEAVVHIPSQANANAMVATSADFEAGIDEFSACGLTPTPSQCIKPARVAEAAIAMETRMLSHQLIGNAPSDVFFLEVLHFYIDDKIYTDGKIDTLGLDACGRLGGDEYCTTTNIIQIARRVLK
ncbi:hypothetical protein TI05_01200 [Achromatium sp. WMS3]|nr:hypothetical protein TI05_01200 [Achromatium sp. WMS3]